MSVPPYVEGDDGTGRGRVHVDAARLWTGGIATALVVVVGVLIARGLFDVPVLAPEGEGALGNASTARLAILAAVAALLATGLMHLLLLSTPRPFRFFTWLISLLTLVAVLAPFMTDAELATKVATAAIGLVIGMAIGSLVSGAGRSAIRLGRQDPRLPEH
jgi:membrane associated rhomboid family serine protease